MASTNHTVLLAGVNKACRFSSILLTRIQRFLLANGHTVTLTPEEADVVIFSPCGVFDKYSDETLKRVREYVHHRDARVVIVGCTELTSPLSREAEENLIFMTDANGLDDFFEADHKLAEFDGHTSQALSDKSFRLSEPGNGPVGEAVARARKHLLYAVLPKRSHLSAVLQDIDRKGEHFVGIGRGCIGNCTYCVEKHVSPEIVSRPSDDILKDIEGITDPITRLALTADDCGAYGVDHGESLFSLLDKIGARFPDLDIKIFNIYPGWFVDHENEYLECFTKSRLTSLNIALQSGSPSVLKRMNREYDLPRILGFVDALRVASPKTLIWTHILPGFPGETEEDFKESLKIAEHFDYFFVYPYSRHPTTPSAGFDGQVPQAEIRRRARCLRRKLHVMLSKRFLKDLVGGGGM